MSIAWRDKNPVGQQRHPVFGDHCVSARDGSELTSEYTHERDREVLGDEYRDADPLRKSVEQYAQSMDTACRSTDRKDVDRIGRHHPKRRLRTFRPGDR
jgi:hypothetical protein